MAMAPSDQDTDWGIPGLAQLFEMVLDAAAEKRDLSLADRDQFAIVGSEARDAGMALSSLIATYLGGAGELWEQIFTNADPSETIGLGRSLRKVSEQAVAALAAGFETSQRQSIRAEEARRREFLEDLLSGTATESQLAGDARPVGFSSAASWVVAVADGSRQLSDAGPVQARVRTELTSRAPQRRLHVFTKNGQLVVVAPDGDPEELGLLTHALATVDDVVWRIGVGSSQPGLTGVATSYRHALEALRLGHIFDLERFLVFDRLLPYRLMAADPSVAESLVRTVIEPLANAPRGSLLETLRSFIENGANMAEVARELSLGARTVAYRLDRIGQLTGHSPKDPDGRFVLELAYRAAPITAATSNGAVGRDGADQGSAGRMSP